MIIYSIIRKIKKFVGICSAALGFRYGSMNFSPTNLHSNQNIEQVETSVNEEDFDIEQNKGTLIKTGSGILISNQPISKDSNSALDVRGGDLGKSGPGARAKNDAHRNAKARRSTSRSSIIPGAEALVPPNAYYRNHQAPSLSCKPKAHVAKSFQGDADNHQPPPENGSCDASQYKGGPNPFRGKFDYDNPNYTRENTDFSSQKRMSHAYDRHAKKCFNMKLPRNKENLKEFERKTRSFINSSDTERINGSYRYETPAYFYKQNDNNLVVVVNATDNSFITVVNATESQLESIKEDHNFGLDTRRSMQLTLWLRGPKNHN